VQARTRPEFHASKRQVLLPGVFLRMMLIHFPHPKGRVSVNPLGNLYRVQTAGPRSRIRVHGLFDRQNVADRIAKLSGDLACRAVAVMFAGDGRRGVIGGPHRPGTTAPSVDKTARALAGKAGARLQPTGAYAANLLGLSDQVPAKVVFLTDGRSKRIKLGKLDIVLKQTSPRTMATAGKISGLVIQALRYLGKTHVNDNTVKRLERKLSADDRKQLLADLAYAPTWIGNIMRRLAAEL